MIKFDNKLELRYYFNDKSNYMDAMIKHRSEKEVLSLVRTLADMLDIKMTVYCESFAQQEGFREIWSVAGENSRLISVLLNLFMQVWTRPSLWSVDNRLWTVRWPTRKRCSAKLPYCVVI